MGGVRYRRARTYSKDSQLSLQEKIVVILSPVAEELVVLVVFSNISMWQAESDVTLSHLSRNALLFFLDICFNLQVFLGKVILKVKIQNITLAFPFHH